MKQLTLVLLVLLTKNLSASSYGVPVPADLSAYSHWNLKGASAKVVGDTLSVVYNLPPELVGTKAPAITFTGTVGTSFVEVKGHSVKGYCMVFTEKPVTCMLRYPKTLIDEPSRDLLLSQEFSGADLFARERVAKFFSSDPAGLLTVDLE